MTQFSGSHILSVNQLDLDAINTIFNVAEDMTPYALREKRTKVLDGAILGNLFLNLAHVPESVLVVHLTYLAVMLEKQSGWAHHLYLKVSRYTIPQECYRHTPM